MTTHTNCTHPATKAGRAACRAGKEVRTDAHRPSVFQPEDYDFSHTGTYSTDTGRPKSRQETEATSTHWAKRAVTVSSLAMAALRFAVLTRPGRNAGVEPARGQDR